MESAESLLLRDFTPPYAVVNAEGRALFVSARAEAYWSKDKAGARAIAGGLEAELKAALSAADGKPAPAPAIGEGAPIRISARPLPSSAGAQYLVVFADDLSGGATHAARMAAIVDSSDDAILSKTMEGIITSWNKGAEHIYGYTAEEVLGKSISLIIPPDRPDELPRIMRRLAAGERIEHYETRRAAKDGRVLDISLTVSPIRDKTGAVVGASAVARDITKSKRDERNLREQLRVLETLTKVNTLLASELDTGKLLQSVVEAGTQLSGGHSGVLIYKAEGAINFNRFAVAGDRPEALREFAMSGASGLIARVVEKKSSLRQNRDPNGHPADPLRCLLAAPVILNEEEVFGVLLFACSGPEFSQRAETLAQGLAVQAAVALKNARLYEKTRRQEQRFLTLLNSTAEGIFGTDGEGRCSFANSACLRLLGYDNPKDLLGSRIHELIHYAQPDGSPLEEECPILRCIERGEPTHADNQVFWRRDGTFFSVDLRAHPLEGSGGCVVSFVDITERRRAEEALISQKRELDAITNALPVLIACVDGEERCIFINKASTHWLGKAPEEVVGRRVSELVDSETYASTQPFIRQALGGRDVKFEVDLKRIGGAAGFGLARFVPRLDAGASVTGFYAAVTDITELRYAQEQLHQMALRLEERVMERTRQLEEQTRLLRRLANQLSETEQTERRRLAEILHDHLQQLLVAAKINLGNLKQKRPDEKTLAKVQGLLDESIGLARNLTAELRPPVLYEGGLIAALEMLARKMEDQHGLKVNLTLEEKAEPRQDSIKSILYQAAREFLFNAVKYAGVGTADLQLKAVGGNLQLFVSDEGRGFDPGVIDIHQTDAHRYGLFSIRERIAGLGGSLTIHSSPGKGTKVGLLLPVEPGSPGAAQQAPEETASAGEAIQRSANVSSGALIRILIVDDHQLVRQGIANMIDEHPTMEVVSQACDGLDAVEEARRCAPDVIIMDLNMPVMNGIEATRAIKAEMPGVKIIGLSVHDEAEAAESMKKAGACAYITKGGDLGKLISVIESCARPTN